jgi:hypothetical protein
VYPQEDVARSDLMAAVMWTERVSNLPVWDVDVGGRSYLYLYHLGADYRPRHRRAALRLGV